MAKAPRKKRASNAVRRRPAASEQVREARPAGEGAYVTHDPVRSGTWTVKRADAARVTKTRDGEGLSCSDKDAARASLTSRVGISVSAEHLGRMVEAALAEQRCDLFGAPDAELSAAEAAVLGTGGFELGASARTEDPLARGVAEYAALLETARTVGQAARQAGVDPSRIRQRLGARTLLGVRAAGGWRIPLFQFESESGGLLAGLEKVLPAIDRDAHPIAVQRWFLSLHPDLAVEDEEGTGMSPRDWLRHGLPPARVAELALEI